MSYIVEVVVRWMDVLRRTDCSTGYLSHPAVKKATRYCNTINSAPTGGAEGMYQPIRECSHLKVVDHLSLSQSSTTSDSVYSLLLKGNSLPLVSLNVYASDHNYYAVVPLLLWTRYHAVMPLLLWTRYHAVIFLLLWTRYNAVMSLLLWTHYHTVMCYYELITMQ